MPLPWGNVSLPNLQSAEVDITTGALKLTTEAIPADAFPAHYALRALFANGSHYDVQKWDVLPQQIAFDEALGKTDHQHGERQCTATGEIGCIGSMGCNELIGFKQCRCFGK